ncbi:MAG: 23S rRNA (adenine(2503)-C(2))-methyltransferase RlmN [Rickettsiales bacterium]|jgi:23S rRNA (adenine2503-C2)-methyltransferase|nr:23S rRNA (adenine(2503)-C(2))-methyltransferase RlmN [Rickettsiales bacterium]
MTQLINILGLYQEELAEKVNILDIPKFRSKQIWNWIYSKGVTDFKSMKNIGNKEFSILADNFNIERPKIVLDITSQDGTRKWLVSFADNKQVEMVFIPEEDRGTICISSQIGCTLSCKFCHTGTQTLVRNLECSEIIAQIILAKDLLNDWNIEQKKITNIVFMGMGEPFFNYDNVAKSIKIITNKDGLGFSLKKITISTAGLVPEIIRSATEIKANLAISLHSTNDKSRSEIMAINKKYPLTELMKACKHYNTLNKQQKITFEYVMLENINDKTSNAIELVNLIKKFNLHCKVNLIPFNPWNGCKFSNSNIATINNFQNILKKNDIITTIRKTRGEDTLSACGQLKSLSQRVKNNAKK